MATAPVFYPNQLSGSFSVTSSACPAWSVASNASWIAVTPVATGAGSGTVTYSAFSNTSAVARNGTITVTNASTAATFSVTQAPSTETLFARVIRALYQVILLREPDLDGFAFWTGPAGTSQPVFATADAMLTSPEFLKGGYLKAAVFQVLLNRKPTFAEWRKAGSQSLTELVVGLLSSTEYSSGILNGAPFNDDLFLTQLYASAFGRPPDPGGFQFWINGLSNLSLAPSDVAVAFADSPEFRARSNPLYVNLLYFTLLQRDPDPDGYQFWLSTSDSLGAGLLFSGNSSGRRSIMIRGFTLAFFD